MLNVIDLLRQKNIEPKKVSGTKGGEYHSPCPGCGGEDRFHVWPDQKDGNGSFWCRGCDKGGDSITFLMAYDGMTYPQACKALDVETVSQDLYRTPKPPVSSRVPNTWKPEPAGDPPSPKWLEKAALFLDWAHGMLLNNPDQLSWLAARGIRMESVHKYKLGWNPGEKGKDLYRWREAWGLPPILNEKTGRKKPLWLPIGLVIPYLMGDIVQRLRIRRPTGQPRYYVVPGSNMQRMLFQLANKAYVVVESELDAILIDQEAGDITGAVALGSDHAKPDTASARHLRASAIILNAIDYDESGHKAIGWWPDHFPQSERWPVPVGKDPGDAFKEGENIREWILAGLPPAWHVGSFLDNLPEKGAPDLPQKISTPDPAPVPESAQALPEGVKLLAELLKIHPVKIYATPDRTTIRESANWARHNAAASKKVSELVYFSPGVMHYLTTHPQKLITGSNIIQEMEGN